MAKRIFLFIVTNLAVLLLLSVTAQLLSAFFGIRLEPTQFTTLIVFASIMGFGGAFISLALSKWMAKTFGGAQVIEKPSNSTEQWLVDTVRRLAQQAGIGMPEVAIFNSPEINAFATGMSRDNALVAVSAGLLQSMDRDEAEAVLGHEVSHIANGDMVTLTLLQGVLNTFVIVLARVIGTIVDNALRGNQQDDDRSGYGMGYFITSIVAQIVLGVLASMIVMWFSRKREFRADYGGAKLAGRGKMISALERLKRGHEPVALPDQMKAFGIAGGGGGFSRLFMSHPPLDERIAALQQLSM